jgi:hypothetical protein
MDSREERIKLYQNRIEELNQKLDSYIIDRQNGVTEVPKSKGKMRAIYLQYRKEPEKPLKVPMIDINQAIREIEKKLDLYSYLLKETREQLPNNFYQ